MTCDEARLLQEADADGELDLVRHLQLETHRRGCPACAARAQALAARHAALRGALPRFAAPPAFRQRIHGLVGAGPASAPAGDRRRFQDWSAWNLGGLAAALALALTVGYSWGTARARTASLGREAIAEHVRSLQASHLLDVVSTDQHTVKPWFIGRLDFSPPVADLADAGFPLAGGRLEQIDGRPAAALVFHRRLHAINLFVWPANAGAVGSHTGGDSGYRTESWTEGGLNFLAVSEIPSAELDQFAAEFRRRTR